VSVHLGLRLASLAALWGTSVAGESFAQSSPRPPFVEDEIAGVQYRLDVRGVVDGVNVAGVPEQIAKVCRDANLSGSPS